MSRRKDLSLASRVRPVTQLSSLEAEARVKFAVGKAWQLVLAAEVKIPVLWVANRPAAVIGQEREDRLALAQRDYRVVVSKGRGSALIHTLKSPQARILSLTRVARNWVP